MKKIFFTILINYLLIQSSAFGIEIHSWLGKPQLHIKCSKYEQFGLREVIDKRTGLANQYIFSYFKKKYTLNSMIGHASNITIKNEKFDNSKTFFDVYPLLTNDPDINEKLLKTSYKGDNTEFKLTRYTMAYNNKKLVKIYKYTYSVNKNNLMPILLIKGENYFKSLNYNLSNLNDFIDDEKKFYFKIIELLKTRTGVKFINGKVINNCKSKRN